MAQADEDDQTERPTTPTGIAAFEGRMLREDRLFGKPIGAAAAPEQRPAILGFAERPCGDCMACSNGDEGSCTGRGHAQGKDLHQSCARPDACE